MGFFSRKWPDGGRFFEPCLWRVARAGQLLIAFLPNFPPLWRAARAGQLIVCLSAQFAPVLARGSSGTAYQCLAALYRVRPERASLSFTRPERASLSFAFMPDLRRSPNCVKSTPWRGGGGTPYYSMKGCSLSRTKGNGYGVTARLYTRALPPNVHALRTY